MELTVHLQKTCVRVLYHCREFKDRHVLEPLFGIEPLTKYPSALPLEVRSRIDLVEIVIHNLVTYSGTRGEPLLDLLGVLRDKREESEAEWSTLDELFKQVSFYLSSLARESTEPTQQKRSQESETRDLRNAVQLYTEAPRSSNEAETADNWIGQFYSDHDEWAFRIALSVFNGGPWDLCMESALELAKRLKSANDSKTGMAGSVESTTPASRSSLSPLKVLAQAGGELLTENTRRVVRLKYSQLSREVLDYVWDEYTRRELLTSWLSDLVISRNQHNRIRGSIAAGFLMLNNFESIQRGLLNQWARADDSRSYRQAIGRALGVVAEEGSRLADVQALLEFWASSSEQELRWAAARAYIYVGLRCSVKDVIKQWRDIAEAEEFASATINFGNIQWVLVNPLHVSLLDAMERLFLNATEIAEVRRAAFIEGVEGFKQWSDDEQLQDDDTDDEGGAKQVTVGFGLMMLIKLARMILPTEDEWKCWPPVLVTLMEPDKSDSSYRRSLVEVFEQLLLDPASQPTALEILREWLNRVEKSNRYEAELRSFIDDLLARVSLQGEILRSIAMHLDLWSPRSRFRLRPAHPAFGDLQHVVLVVDGSESALRYWTEIRSLALEVGSALSDTIVPEVYLLNSGEVTDMMKLADTRPESSTESRHCSLIAPVMRDLIRRRQKTDAVIVIGNGEVFDLPDWLGHPSVDRWILVHLGPDRLLSEKTEGRNEITEDAAVAVYERLLGPIESKRSFSTNTKVSSVANDRWSVDRSGFPIVRIDSLQRYVHLFPVAKIQFEKFISDRNDSSWGDDVYGELLALNSRASFREKAVPRYEQLFLTGIKPPEVTEFATWLGDEYSTPDNSQWLACYEWLANQPIPEPPVNISEDALGIWQLITAVRTPRTLLDLSLMSQGIKEWVSVVGKTEAYAGLGCPVQRFPTLSRDPRALVHVTTLQTRLHAYGFRLLRR